jgi:hypothetical protein
MDTTQKYEAQRIPLQQQNEQLKQDVISGKIDANRLVGSMSTGQKIATAIGLIAGGIGAGLTKSENMAAKFLQSQIDNDIAAQRVNLGKKESLLSMNLRELGDIRDAETKTRADQLSLASLGLQQAAAKAGDPLAKSRLMQEAGKLDIQVASILAPLEAKQQVKAQFASGQMSPEAAINVIVPEKDRTAARDEVSMIQGFNASSKAVKEAFKGAAGVGSFDAMTGKEKSEWDSRNAHLVSVIKSTMKGQVSDKDAEMQIEPLLPARTDTKAQLEAKKTGMLNILKAKIGGGTPVLRGVGIDLEKIPGYSTNAYTNLSPKEKQYADWAMKNNRDPKAQLVLDKLGLQ